MSDFFQGPLGAFDIVCLAIIVVSAVMSLGRGLIREASSVAAFILGGLTAYYAVSMFKPTVQQMLPEGWPSITASAILVVVGFLAAYSLAAFVGSRLSKLINSNPEIGLLDRLGGAAFGAARGALSIVLFVLLMQQVLPEESTPSFVADSKIFPYAEAAAEWIRDTAPGVVDKAKDKLPPLKARDGEGAI